MWSHNAMHIDVAEQNGAAVVRPLGARVDLQSAGEFRNALLQLIDVGHHKLVVDLSNVEFVDSSGLGALVSALKTLKLLKGGGDIRLANVQPSVVALLEIIRLHRVFFSYPSVDQAVQSFN
jgi:anti-sigma B factor antagonist